MTDWKRVGEFARNRRKQLKLTQSQIQEGGGPSTALVRQIELGTYTADQMQTGVRVGYERVLGWEEGSIELVGAGGLPRLLAGFTPDIYRPEGAHRSAPPLTAKGLSLDELVDEWGAYTMRAQEIETEYALRRGKHRRDARTEITEAWFARLTREGNPTPWESEEGEGDGSTTETPKAQKTSDLEERRARRAEVSEADDTLSPAALDAEEGVDEEPGGSDERD